MLTDQLTKYVSCGVSIDVDGWIEFNPFDTSTFEVIRSTTFRFQSLILFNLYLFCFPHQVHARHKPVPARDQTTLGFNRFQRWMDSYYSSAQFFCWPGHFSLSELQVQVLQASRSWSRLLHRRGVVPRMAGDLVKYWIKYFDSNAMLTMCVVFC